MFFTGSVKYYIKYQALLQRNPLSISSVAAISGRGDRYEGKMLAGYWPLEHQDLQNQTQQRFVSMISNRYSSPNIFLSYTHFNHFKL